LSGFTLLVCVHLAIAAEVIITQTLAGEKIACATAARMIDVALLTRGVLDFPITTKFRDRFAGAVEQITGEGSVARHRIFTLFTGRQNIVTATRLMRIFQSARATATVSSGRIAVITLFAIIELTITTTRGLSTCCIARIKRGVHECPTNRRTRRFGKIQTRGARRCTAVATPSGAAA
jgi:hypothetical protein